MKIVEYSAAGLPVVCTDQVVFRTMRFENTVLTGFEPGEFADGIVSAMEMPRHQPLILSEYSLQTVISRLEELLL